ncbi:glutathione S-transferase family protein [Paragemmobacter straminiformis]|nr:glutathione S-transferase family protein [Gemmobacter straminiformis]
MTLTLYSHPMSRGRMARWMLEEVGQPYEVVYLDYGTSMKAPGYLALNPMGKVPALVHDGHVVTECAAVIAYLADAFPQAGLMAPDRAAFYRWMFFGAGPFEAAVTNRALGVEVPPEKAGFVGYGGFDRVLDTLDATLSARDWLAGDGFSAADLYVGSQLGYGLVFGTLPARASFTAYWNRIKDRPARLRASALDDAALAKAKQNG